MAAPTNVTEGKPAALVPGGSDVPANLAALTSQVASPTEAYTVTSAAISFNVATLVFSGAHKLRVGDVVTVASVGAAYNGSKTVIAVPTATSIQFAVSAADSPAAGSDTTAAADFRYKGSVDPVHARSVAASGTVTTGKAWIGGTYVDLADASKAYWTGSAWAVGTSPVNYTVDVQVKQQPGARAQTLNSQIW